MERLTFQPSDLDALWEAENEFWARFTDADWQRRHGRDWTFADALYHLTYFNQLVVDSIHRAPDAPLPSELNTLDALNDWNARQFARRSTFQEMQQAQHDFKASQIALREASHNLDQSVWLPLLRVGGWRTLQFALEYTFYHNWLHFAEAHLRRNNWLPGLPERMMHIGLDFQMDVIAGAVNLELAAKHPLRWALHLTDNAGGWWTFEMNATGGTVVNGLHGQPDITTTTTIQNFLKTSVLGIDSPSRAVLMRRIHVQGIQHLSKLRALFNTPSTMVWPLLERGRPQLP